MGIPEEIADLLEPVIATLDVELLDVEWTGASLRLVIDRAPGGPDTESEPRGVSTGQLAAVNRLVSPILDQHDPIPGRYTLEVSSPGVERKLTRATHFVRAIGEEVVVKLVPAASLRRVKGPLMAFDTDREILTLQANEIDGVDQGEPAQVEISLADVQRARTSFNWGPGPKPGKGSKPGKGTKRSKSENRGQSPRTQQNQKLKRDKESQ